MIRLTDTLWIGNSADEQHGDFYVQNINAVLNVARDLQGTRGWMEGIEYMQVGLVDGPGNPLGMYHAAILAVTALCNRGRTLMYDHTGGRALAIAIMYLNTQSRHGWDGWLAILRERVDTELPELHEAHRAAFNKLNWRFLEGVAE